MLRSTGWMSSADRPKRLMTSRRDRGSMGRRTGVLSSSGSMRICFAEYGLGFVSALGRIGRRDPATAEHLDETVDPLAFDPLTQHRTILPRNVS